MANASTWMIYGANGYTGVLLAEEALRRGHRPMLAGRNVDKLAPIAKRLGLPLMILDLHDRVALERALTRVDLVLHAAGPFIATSEPMMLACLATRTHYLDITGEFPVFAQGYRYHDEARARGIVMLSGVGFDVVPTDCLSKHVADQLPDSRELEIAIAGLGGLSAGTAKSMLAGAGGGVHARREGELKSLTPGQGAKRVRFADRDRAVLPIPWGDIESAYRTTGVPNITTYMAVPRKLAQAATRLGWLAETGRPLLQRALQLPPLNDAVGTLIERAVVGPDEPARSRGKAQVWVRAKDRAGRVREAWLETPNGYAFTASAGVRCVERTLAEQPRGALTPALAFGADLVLEIDGVRRWDQLH